MENEKINVEFTGEEFDLILKYMEVSEATTVQYAILNAISIALDRTDFIGKCKDCKWFGRCPVIDEVIDIDIDWCFNPNKEGAVATLWSCKDWERKRTVKVE